MCVFWENERKVEIWKTHESYEPWCLHATHLCSRSLAKQSHLLFIYNTKIFGHLSRKLSYLEETCLGYHTWSQTSPCLTLIIWDKDFKRHKYIQADLAKTIINTIEGEQLSLLDHTWCKPLWGESNHRSSKRQKYRSSLGDLRLFLRKLRVEFNEHSSVAKHSHTTQ